VIAAFKSGTYDKEVKNDNRPMSSTLIALGVSCGDLNCSSSRNRFALSQSMKMFSDNSGVMLANDKTGLKFDSSGMSADAREILRQLDVKESVRDTFFIYSNFLMRKLDC